MGQFTFTVGMPRKGRLSEEDRLKFLSVKQQFIHEVVEKLVMVSALCL